MPVPVLRYFDESVFAGRDLRDGFFAQKALAGHYNGAAKIHMTWTDASDAEEDKKRKAGFFEHWKDWRACLDMAKTKPEKTAFHYLLRKPDDFLGFLYEIPLEVLTSYYQSYQAYLWNEILRKIAAENPPEEYLKTLEIPLFSEKSKMPDSLSERTEKEVLEREKIGRSMLSTTKFRKVRFRPGSRHAAA